MSTHSEDDEEVTESLSEIRATAPLYSNSDKHVESGEDQEEEQKPYHEHDNGQGEIEQVIGMDTARDQDGRVGSEIISMEDVTSVEGVVAPEQEELARRLEEPQGELLEQNEEIAHQQSGEEEKEEEEDEEDEEGEEDGEENEEDEDEDDEEEEEEPKLRYQRLSSGVADLLKTDSASAIVVSDKLVALGTHEGLVHVLDLEGNVVKSFTNHSATVNDLSIDEAGEYIASASQDGTVKIRALYNSHTISYDYYRPIKAVALDPLYSYANTQRFISGGMAEQLNFNDKGWFGQNNNRILSGSEGPIYTIMWKGQWVAWANDLGVKVLDMNSLIKIAYIARPENSPRADLYRCHLYWKDANTLLIGWADAVKVAVVKDRPKPEQVQGVPPYCMEITTMFQTDFIVCGISPFNDLFLLLAFETDDLNPSEEPDIDDPSVQRKKPARKPELRLYNEFADEISSDVLGVTGYAIFQANDYILVPVPSQDMFYMVSPKDVIVAKPRDLDDHIEWLLEHRKFKEALDAAREAAAWEGSKRFDVNKIGSMYLEALVTDGKFEEAAAVMPSVLGNDKAAWEKWVFKFTELRQLHAITPYVPTGEPQLSSTIYEMILAYHLAHDPPTLLKTIQTWPLGLYNLETIIVAVQDVLEQERHANIGKDNENRHPRRNTQAIDEGKQDHFLIEALAELYTYNRQPNKALEYMLRLRNPRAIDFIIQYSLFEAVKDKALLLMEFDQFLLEKKKIEVPNLEANISEKKKKWKPTKMPAVQLLVDHTDAVPPQGIVKQLRRSHYFLHIYLDALFDKDPHLGNDFHDLQVELYAEYDYPKLLDFLRASSYYNMEKAYVIFERRDLVPEMVYILGRMGDNKKALMLIIERLRDVQRAIDFAKEQNDDDLWEDLLTYSMDKPTFIIGLLENAGTEIDPIKLIQRIPNSLEIPGLKHALVKIMQDFNLQTSLREGCGQILVSDSVSLADRLHAGLKKGVAIRDDMNCEICGKSILRVQNPQPSIIFWCRHTFHEDCLFEHDVPDVSDKYTSGSIASKIDYISLLRSIRSVSCPICEEQRVVGTEASRSSAAELRFVRSARALASTHATRRSEDSLPPMVPLNFHY